MSIGIKFLKKGDVVWECEYGENLKMVIQEDAIDTGEGYQAIGRTASGKDVKLYNAYGFEHYGPKLYKSPQYFYNEGGEISYIDSGETY